MNNYTSKNEEIPSSVSEIFEKFIFQFKRFWFVPIALMIFISAFLCINEKRNYSPSYKAYVTFIVSVEGDYNNYYGSMTADQMESTFPYLLTSDVLIGVVAEDLGLTSVPGSIGAESLSGTGLFTITATSYDPDMAYKILNSVVKNYPTVADFVLGDTTLRVLDESGLPTEPINSINYNQCISKGMLYGLILGLAFILIVAVARQTIYNRDELKQISNVRCIGVIPEVSFKKRSKVKNEKVLITNSHISHGYLEAFRNVRTRVEKNPKSITHKLFLLQAQ